MEWHFHIAVALIAALRNNFPSWWMLFHIQKNAFQVID
jgi:hypothetical protein